MKKINFILLIFFLLPGCTGIEEQDVSDGEDRPRYRGVPIELRVPEDKPISVKANVAGAINVQAERALPVKLQVQEGSRLPVELKMQNDQAFAVRIKTQDGQILPVKLQMGDGGAIPVEIKLPWFVPVLAAALGAILLVIAITAVVAARYYRQSAIALKSALERIENNQTSC